MFLQEAYRKTADIADKMELACKDRKIIKLKPEMLEILHYEASQEILFSNFQTLNKFFQKQIENPLDDDVIEYAYTKEILIFLWKLGETDTRTPEVK